MSDDKEYMEIVEATDIQWIHGTHIGVGMNMTTDGKKTTSMYMLLKIETMNDQHGNPQEFVVAGNTEGMLKFAEDIIDVARGLLANDN